MITLFLVFWSFALSAAVVLYTTTPVIIVLCAIVAFIGAWYFKDMRIFFPLDDKEAEGKKEAIPTALFLFLSAACLFLLFRSGSSDALLSPWQAIHPWFLPAFFLLTFVLGALLFSGHSTKMILFFIIIHAFVQHAYLPLSHELPWGGDVWRHIAVEEKLLAGEIVPPAFPEALLIPHKYTYGQLWGVSAALGMTGMPLTQINRWFMPILWSIALPFLLFQLGVLLFDSRRSALVLAALPAISFPFQALGALTLPVSLGFLTFLFALFVWCRALQTGEKKMKLLALILAALMVFGYALYVVFLWAVIGASAMLTGIKNKELRIKNIASGATMLFGVLIFPVIDLVVGGSRLPAAWNMLHAAKQFLGQFSGWYYASAIRPHDILSGNIFFNHTPSAANVLNFFTMWRWWIIPAMLALWSVAAVGFFKAPKERVWQILQICGMTVGGGYIIGWYILEGDRLFTRRLDLTLAFLTIIFLLQGISYVSSHYTLTAKRYTLAAVVFFVSCFATATYASGPDLRVVSEKEYSTAREIWQSEQLHAPPYCVLVDTWVLLPLEAISAGRIVGGGFPIDRQFGQAERVRLYDAYREGGDDEILEEAKRATGAKSCVVIP